MDVKNKIIHKVVYYSQGTPAVIAAIISGQTIMSAEPNIIVIDGNGRDFAVVKSCQQMGFIITGL